MRILTPSQLFLISNIYVTYNYFKKYIPSDGRNGAVVRPSGDADDVTSKAVVAGDNSLKYEIKKPLQRSKF